MQCNCGAVTVLRSVVRDKKEVGTFYECHIMWQGGETRKAQDLARENKVH